MAFIPSFSIKMTHRLICKVFIGPRVMLEFALKDGKVLFKRRQ